ncbi:MAG: hypothetical protein MAGBODY4_01099 [Candidatus Marinimicrobia bacterium]|nr:hypothetical protein [Candidatus Neomarinimicrobiota bacterium]
MTGLLLCFIWLFSVTLNAQSSLKTLYSALNFPAERSITISEVRQAQPEINSRFTYLDGYRKYRTGDRALYWANPGWKGSGFMPLDVAEFMGALQVGYSETYPVFSNQQDQSAIRMEVSGVSRKMDVQFALSDGQALLGGGFDATMTDVRSPVNILEYPYSDTPRMNRFLFDWLPLTFGHQQEFEHDGSSFSPTVFATLPTSSDAVVSLQYRYVHSSGTPAFFYTNASNKEALQGQRRMTFRSNGNRNYLRAGYIRPKKRCEISMAVFRFRLATDIDNHPPETTPILLDFTSLGGGNIDRLGGNVRWEQILRSGKLALGVGYSDITGSFSVTTPVLGYYDDLLPISHGVSGTFSGTVFSQNIRIQGDVNLFGFTVAPDIRYTHGFVDLTMNGEAALEFNLISEPVYQPLQYDVHLLEGKVAISKQLQRVRLGYEVTQLLPYAERVDSSAIRLGEPKRPTELSHRGGRLHTITFSHFW